MLPVAELNGLRDIDRAARREVVEAAGVQRRARPKSPGSCSPTKPALPGTMRDLRVVGLRRRAIAGRGEVRHAFRGDLIDRLRNDAVLEERFGQIDDVVDDHVRLEARHGVRRVREAGECANVVCEAEFAAVRRRESEARFRRDVVNDLQHGAAFVGAAGKSCENDDRLGVAERIARTGEIAASRCRAAALFGAALVS